MKQWKDGRTPITGRYDEDVAALNCTRSTNGDVRIREFDLGRMGIRAAVFFLDGLSDKELIEEQILLSLMSELGGKSDSEKWNSDRLLLRETIRNQILPLSEMGEASLVEETMLKVLSGSTALIIDGVPTVLLIGSIKGRTRSVEEPETEGLIRGPRVGFNETLSDNTALLRRHGENGSMAILKFKVGKRAQKDLVVAYMEDIADPKLVEEVKRRIAKINIDNLPESGYVEQLIEDNYLSPFPQAQSTERPDRVISSLMEGRVAILLDGTPFALLVPVTFSMLLQSPEDYYERWIVGSLVRLLRFFAVFISLFVPALYISFISFHPGLIPTKLAISIIKSREFVPFSALMEALIMEIAIEILREAGIRLPKPIGPAMGIVGGLIVGEAAVQAGIVSQILVIVVAVTAIATFTIPFYSAGLAFRYMRFVAMFCAALFGMYGVVLFFLFLSTHLVKLKSFGVPYANPSIPYRISIWKDLLIRAPLRMMKKRPELLHTQDPIRKK